MHSNKVKHACVLGTLTGLEDIGELNRGISFQDRFPENVRYQLDPDFPDHLTLTDSLMNSDGLIVASTGLKTHLQQAGLDSVEYHPVQIVDHKGKEFAPAYFIVHPTNPVDGLDADALGARPSRILKGIVSNVQKLVLRPDAIPPGRKLFRLLTFRKVTLIRRELAADLDKAGFTGFRWLEPS